MQIRVIVALENKSESLCEARLVADVERVSFARENESDLLREAISAADVDCRM